MRSKQSKPIKVLKSARTWNGHDAFLKGKKGLARRAAVVVEAWMEAVNKTNAPLLATAFLEHLDANGLRIGEK
jgi:hypothetical protein